MNTLVTDSIARLSLPTSQLIEQSADWGDVVILGAGGKIGSDMAGMLASAFRENGNPSRIFAVSRWSDQGALNRLRDFGVEPVAADVSESGAIRELPDSDRVIYLVGAKFATSDAPYKAWMTNTVLPAAVADRYRDGRIVALSTGNVYPYTSADTGGPDETVVPSPIGDYAQSCLGRERVFQNAAREYGTRVALLRLNYACEPRYGVIADIARRLLAGDVIDLSVGSVNVVDQRYVNDVILRSLDIASSPETTLNLSGPETASVRWIADQLAGLLGVEARFSGQAGATALLSNGAKCHQLMGYPELSLGALIEQQGEWLNNGGELWDKPTKYERTDGKF